jgi:hypothetical protein
LLLAMAVRSNNLESITHSLLTGNFQRFFAA